MNLQFNITQNKHVTLSWSAFFIFSQLFSSGCLIGFRKHHSDSADIEYDLLSRFWDSAGAEPEWSGNLSFMYADPGQSVTG